jgi:hypothetical protein
MTPQRDLADRYLGLVVRLLPAGRGDWGRAMQADLAAIEGRPARVRFALGCTRLVLLPSARMRSAGLLLGVACLIGLSGEIGPVLPIALILGLFAWLGRRAGYFGPVRDDWVTRAVRTGGWGLVAAVVLVQLTGRAPGHIVLTTLVTLLTAAFLAATASASRVSGAALGAGAGAGLLTGAAGFVVAPFERIGTPLAHGLPLHGRWLVLVVFAAPAAAALLTAQRTRRAEQGVMATVCAGAVGSLTFGLLGLAAIVLFPGSVPDIVGSVMMPGTSDAARQAADATEAADPYWGFLPFAAMLATLLWAVARPPTRSEAKVGLLAVLGVPPIALAVAGGAGTIALATAAVIVAAAVATRREAIAPG